MTSEEFKHKLFPVNQKLFRLSWRILGDVKDAEDVVQEVYLKLWDVREKLSDIRNHEAYATTMTKNLSLDRLKLRRTVPIDNMSDSVYAKLVVDSAHESLENRDNAGLINQIISRLPEQQRIIMVMRDLEQYSFEEIQEVTKFDINYIRVNLSRARKQVRDELIKFHNYGTTKSKTTSGEIL